MTDCYLVTKVQGSKIDANDVGRRVINVLITLSIGSYESAAEPLNVTLIGIYYYYLYIQR